MARYAGGGKASVEGCESIDTLVSPRRRAPWSCHSEPLNTTHGCTPNAGPLGINRDELKPTWR
jgi:hypothetical protein